MTTYRVLESQTELPEQGVNDNAPTALAVMFVVTEACQLTEVHYYQPTSGILSTADRPFRLYTTTNGVSGTQIASGTITTSGTGWQTKALDTPVNLNPNVTYQLSVLHPEGRYPYTYDTFAGDNSITVGPVRYLSSNESFTTNMLYNDSPGGVAAFCTLGYRQSNYWNDITVVVDEDAEAELSVSVGEDVSTYAGSPTGLLTANVAGGTGDVSVEWTVQSGPTGVFSAPTSTSTTFTPSEVGVSVLRCTATDDETSVYDELSVTSLEVPEGNRLFGTATPPATSSDATPIVVAVEFSVTDPVSLKSILYYQPSSGTVSTAERTVALYEVISETEGWAHYVGTLTPSGSGWQTHNLTTPVELDPAKSYRAAVFHPEGGYVATTEYFTTGSGASGVAVGYLYAPSSENAIGGDQGSYREGSEMEFPTSSYLGGNYWVDVIVEASAGEEPQPTTKMWFHDGAGWFTGRIWVYSGGEWHSDGN